MALAAATVWEVRTTASDANGGGFVAGATGTDFSQQDAAQFALTGLATAGTGATFLTASAAASMVGNILNVVSGTNFVTGWFQIISVSVGVSVTVDRNICTGVGASGVINIGGALATITKAAALYVASNKIFVKATATYTHTATVTFSTGTDAQGSAPYSRLIGYTATRGDGGRPTIQLSTNSGLSALKTAALSIYIENFIIDCNSLTTSIGVELTGAFFEGLVRNVKIQNFTSAGIKINTNIAIVIDCEVTGGTSAATAGIQVSTGTTVGVGILRNYVHDNACPGVTFQEYCNYVQWNLIVNNTGANSDGLRMGLGGAMGFVTNNTIYGNGRDGIRGNSIYAAEAVQVKNNILVSNGGYGLNLSTAAGWPADPTYDGNAYYNNTSGARNNADDTTTNPQNGVAPYTNVLDKVLSGSPFTNAAGGDFTLNNTAGAGASCRAGGTPGALPGISQLGYIDMGALQHQETGSSVFAVDVHNTVILNRFGVAGY